METNDFLGSFAQENVSFATQIVKTSSVGDNFKTVMIFVESDRFVVTSESAWETAPGLSSCKVLVVNAETYATYTKGLLSAWLYDLFCNGFTGDCILVAPASSEAEDVTQYTKVTPSGTENPQELGWYIYNDTSSAYELSTDTTVQTGTTYYEGVTVPGFVDAMQKAYAVLKAYAYHKTVCAGSSTAVTPAYAVALAKLCAADEYLSSAPLLPCTSSAPASDPLYTALTEASQDAFMAWHSDSTHNAALYSLGLAMAELNGAGLYTGNGMDMIASTNITASNDGANPTDSQKTAMKNAKIQYFKTVGDNSGSVAAEEGYTLKGNVYSAYWILAYITYMTKVGVARLLTQRNFAKNSANYTKILGVLQSYINKFVNGGLLTQAEFNAPSFADLPDTGAAEITITKAWSAYYVSHLHKVSITGTLYIGV